jgi:hypothetical protein
MKRVIRWEFRRGFTAALLIAGIGTSVSAQGPRQKPLQLHELVKGYVGIEPAGFGIPAGQTAATLAGVPILTVFGDYLRFSTQGTGWLTSARATLAQVNTAGGDGTVLVLPDVGIAGNTHMMMMDSNNEQIADIVEGWIKEHVRGVKGRYQP